tara:strand:- start:7516 stop:7872 length:357 start_codon:yes stop_codon:yes gene_type:complete
MAMSRYDGREFMINDDAGYQKVFFDDRDIKQIMQYKTARFSFPTDEEMGGISFYTKAWAATDKLYNLAAQTYGDPQLWWVIAWFNQKPTEAHFRTGDIIYVPLNAEQIVTFFRKVPEG